MMYIKVWLEKTPAGYFRIRYPNPEGGSDVRISTKSKCKVIAEQIRKEYEENLNTKEQIKDFNGNVLFSHVVNRYMLEEMPRKKKSHQHNIKCRIPYIIRTFGNKPVKSITAEMIEDFLNDLERITGKSRKPATVNRWRDHFSAIFTFAIRKYYVRNNPVSEVPKHKENNTSERIMFLSQNHCERLINQAKTGHIWATFLYTGIRLGELIGLRWTDVDFRRNIIFVRRNRSESTKSWQERKIGINPKLLPILKAQKVKINGSELVFPRPDGKMRKASFYGQFKNALKAAGLEDYGYTVHNLRHTAASMWAKAGVDPFLIQKLMGHSSMQTTLGYIHHNEDELQAAVNKLNFNSHNGIVRGN